MNKLKKMILMLCFILSGALCYASGAAGIEDEKGEGIPIEIKDSMGSLSGPEKGETILASIDGHILTVIISESLGQVSIEITTATGALVNCSSVLTPNGQQFYIPNAGNYIVTFTLSNGDEYYGEFTVEN